MKLLQILSNNLTINISITLIKNTATKNKNKNNGYYNLRYSVNCTVVHIEHRRPLHYRLADFIQ